jgi:methionine-rich copper-binding protein CopC
LPLAAAALITVLVAGLVATPAAAHASLISSLSTRRSGCGHRPTKVELIFSEGCCGTFDHCCYGA